MTKLRIQTANLSKIADLITQHRDDLGQFFRDDHRGQKLPEYFTQLQKVLERDKAAALSELRSLMQNLEHIKTIVRSQQSHVQAGWPARDLRGPAAARRCDQAERPRRRAGFDRDRAPVRRASYGEARPPQGLQILVNLLANARDAVMPRPSGARRITVHARRGTPGNLEIAIEDNGCGVAAENLEKIFRLGFTTKSEGPRARPPLQRMRRPRAPRQGHRSLGRPGQRRFVRARPSVRAHRGGRVALRRRQSYGAAGSVSDTLSAKVRRQAPSRLANNVDEGAAILDDLAIDAHAAPPGCPRTIPASPAS